MEKYLIGANGLEKPESVKLEVGTRIYYTGDMANNEGFGTVTKKIPEGKYNSACVNIKMDDGREKIMLPEILFSPKYSGNGSTRFVTQEAYQNWKIERIQAINAEIEAKKIKVYDNLTELENKVLEAIKKDCFYQESEDGSCWCWADQFAKDAGISVESCKAVLGTMVQKKVIRIDDWKSLGEKDNYLQVAEDYR